MRSGREHWAWMVVVGVRQGTLTWMVVVEVRQGTLTWIAVEQEEDEEDEETRRTRRRTRGGGGEEEERGEEERRRRRRTRQEEATDIKSNNPHLAGGEIDKALNQYVYIYIYICIHSHTHTLFFCFHPLLVCPSKQNIPLIYLHVAGQPHFKSKNASCQI